MNDKSAPAFSKTDSLALKGLAILMLILHHLYFPVSRIDGYNISFAPLSRALALDICDYFKICVSFFAFITGYGLYLSAKNGGKTQKDAQKRTASRLIKIMFPFWLVYLIIVISTELYDHFPSQMYASDSLLHSVGYGVLDFLGLATLFNTPTLINTWWYMGAAIIFVIFVPLAIRFKKRFGYIALAVILVAAPRLFKVGYPGSKSAYCFLIAVMLGMVFAEYDVFSRLERLKFANNKPLNEGLTFIILAALLVGSYLFWIAGDKKETWEYHFGIAPLFAIVFAKKYIIKIPGVRQFLCFMGKLSMDIFLTHSFLRAYYLHSVSYSQHNWLLNYLILASASAAVGAALYYGKRLVHFDALIKKATDGICRAIDRQQDVR